MHRTRAHAGFTLVEMIAAIVLLSVAIPPMLWALSEGGRQRAGPIQASRARWLAAAKLEDIIADRHAPARGYGYIAPENYPPEPAPTTAPGFGRSVTINETGPDLASPGSGYKVVTVTVTWRDGRGHDRALDLATVLTDYTP